MDLVIGNIGIEVETRKKMNESEASPERHVRKSRSAAEGYESTFVNEKLAVATPNYVKKSMAAYLGFHTSKCGRSIESSPILSRASCIP